MMPVCLFICVCSVCAKPIFFSLKEKLLKGSGKVYSYFGEIASIIFKIISAALEFPLSTKYQGVREGTMGN